MAGRAFRVLKGVLYKIPVVKEHFRFSLSYIPFFLQAPYLPPLDQSPIAKLVEILCNSYIVSV